MAARASTDGSAARGTTAVARSWLAAYRVRVLALAPSAFALVMLGIGRLNLAHVALALLSALLGFWGPRARGFLADVAPLIAVALGYDAMRFLTAHLVTRERVLSCALRRADLAIFGVSPDLTFGEYIARHHVPALDCFFAIPYTIFIYVVFVSAAYLYFIDRPRMRVYLRAFAIANFLAFACWLVVPAAPPWYVHAHGCSVDMSARPNPAGLARVDALFGIHYFASFYGRASAVFGAMPSMHCAYPLIGLLSAFRHVSTPKRLLHLGYVLTMFFAALYLDHHWVLDAVVGWLLACVAVALASAWGRAEQRASSAPAPTGALDGESA